MVRSPGFPVSMKALLILGLLLLTLIVQGKIYERCEMAKALKKYGMDGYKGISLAFWMCLVKWESGYNTEATKSVSENRSTNYGIFQINSRFWCDDGNTPKSSNSCKISCKALTEADIAEAVNCAKKIVTQQGIKAWIEVKDHCENRNLSGYLRECGV